MKAPSAMLAALATCRPAASLGVDEDAAAPDDEGPGGLYNGSATQHQEGRLSSLRGRAAH